MTIPLWIIPALPLAGFLANGLLGRRLSRRAVGGVACGSVGLAFLAALGVVRGLVQLPPEARAIRQTVYSWIAAGDFQVGVGLLLDPLSAVMVLVVTGVGFLIHIYSVGYMHEDPDYSRYFAQLNLFVFFMLLLVLADNYLLLFVGWEGVGCASYMLIGFWFEREAAARAGLKAFIVNRVGDAGFLIALFLLATTFGTLDYLPIFDQAPALLPRGSGLATAITLLLFMGATAKSAQVPLYVWLPDAMEGPTPVSALIHAATMVTAGVYMVARSHVLFDLAPFSQALVAWIGALTAFFSATIALTQFDMKRIIAYSTISQLGYMFLGAGLGAYASAMFHLTMQAFFKALLFLAAGSVMHALHNETDIRRMGGLRHVLPVTSLSFLVGALANAGIFPFAGFWSKDEILWAALKDGHVALWAVGAATAFVTGLYTFRLYLRIFAGPARWQNGSQHAPHESPPVMRWPLVALALLSFTGGGLGIPPDSGILHRFLGPVFGGEQAVGEGGGIAAALAALVSLALASAGAFVAYHAYIRRPDLPGLMAERSGTWYALPANRYWVDEVYDALVVRPVARIAAALWRVVDDSIVDGAVNAVWRLIGGSAAILRRVQTGHVPTYVVVFLLGVVGILAFLLWGS
jgi:NADH-quinone oxidoreductase subunit L